MELFTTLFADPNARWVLAACVLLGLSSGVLGCFALLRRHSLLGDAVAHASLPGICLAFLVVGTKSIALFLIGAAVSGLLAALCIHAITKYSRIKEDSALGLVLTVFFGFGIVLLTMIQHSEMGNQSGLDSFLFGKAASLIGADVKVMTGTAGVLLATSFLLFKEFKLLSFDPGFGRGLGLPMGLINTILMTLIVAAVVIGLQAVGVVLMAAMLITPALAARYWTERLDRMIVIAGVFGGASGFVGTYVSTLTENMPTGPVIVLSATALFLFSMFFAPRRGLLLKLWKRRALRVQVARENLLQSLYDLAESDSEKGALPLGGYTLDQLLKRRPQPLYLARKQLRKLVRAGLVQESRAPVTAYLLTDQGLELAYRLTQNQRMLEIFLMYEAKLGVLKLDRPKAGNGLADLADELPAETLREVQHLLRLHQLEPKLSPKAQRSRQELSWSGGGAR